MCVTKLHHHLLGNYAEKRNAVSVTLSVIANSIALSESWKKKWHATKSPVKFKEATAETSIRDIVRQCILSARGRNLSESKNQSGIKTEGFRAFQRCCATVRKRSRHLER